MTVAAAVQVDELTRRHTAFRDELIEAGVLFPLGANGLYARSAVYEQVFDALDALITERGRDLDAFRVRFPSLFPLETYEKTDYIASFPDLTGAISSFEGNDLDHADLLTSRAEGADWRTALTPTDMMLVSAACHPLYGLLTGTLPEGGRYCDVLTQCFRREPSPDPFRMQAFRMREYVYVGDEATAIAHRQTWTDRGLQMLGDLGLVAEAVPAHDPFFGRSGNMLAANQLEQNLKTELVVRNYGDDADSGDGTAVMSANYHVEHFGEPFAIRTADGAVAHSACTGIGVERITLALLRAHGFEPATWPGSVRAVLFPEGSAAPR